MLLNSLSENVNTPTANFDPAEFYFKQKFELIVREWLHIYMYMCMFWVTFNKQEKRKKKKK